MSLALVRARLHVAPRSRPSRDTVADAVVTRTALSAVVVWARLHSAVVSGEAVLADALEVDRAVSVAAAFVILSEAHLSLAVLPNPARFARAFAGLFALTVVGAR